MSILTDGIRTFLSLLKINNIDFKSYEIKNNEVIFEINNFKLYTDFYKYCYIDDENLDFNYNILSKYKSPKNIILELLNNKKIENDNIINDPFNIFNNNIKIFMKNEIDYNKLYDKLLLKINNSKLSLVPKSLILSPEQICNIIINELKKINYNKLYKHYVNVNFEEPFILNVILFIKNHIIEFKLILDTFPYLPPLIEYISPPINDELYFAILNLNILQLKNWSSNITLEYIIVKIAELLEPIFDDYISINNTNNILHKHILNIVYLTKDNNINILKLNIDIPSNNVTMNNNYWKSGTGYSNHNSTINWDFNKYISEQEILNTNIINNLNKINNIFIENINIIYRENEIINKYLINFINKQLNEINILELDNNIKLYYEIFLMLDYFDKNKIIFENLRINNNLLQLNEDLELNYSLDDNKYKIKLIITNILSKIDIKIDNIIENDNYCNIMKKLQFINQYNIPKYHNYNNMTKDIIKYDNKTKMRILSEISSFKTGLPLNKESTIWCLTSKTNLNIFTFIISGPKNTPYENGLFEFHAYFPPNYPESVPQVHFHTTGNGKFRFNPNLYSNGKVCLSLLGTWEGHESEKWNSKTSTFLQIMISIQSLILIEEPYFNEPSYERDINTTKGKENSKKYNNNIYSKTIEYGMIELLKNSLEYPDIINNHFKLKKNEIINTVNQWIENNPNNNDLKAISEKLFELLNNL